MCIKSHSKVLRENFYKNQIHNLCTRQIHNWKKIRIYELALEVYLIKIVFETISSFRNKFIWKEINKSKFSTIHRM